MSRGLRAGVFGIHRFLRAMHDVVVDAVFHVRRAVLDSKQPLGIGFVLREQQLRRTFAMQPAIAGLIMIQFDHRVRAPGAPDAAPADASSLPTTRCCGTRPWAAGEDWPLPARDSRP